MWMGHEIQYKNDKVTIQMCIKMRATCFIQFLTVRDKTAVKIHQQIVEVYIETGYAGYTL